MQSRIVFGWEKTCQCLEYLPARSSIRRRGRVGKKAGRAVQVVMKGAEILKKSPRPYRTVPARKNEFFHSGGQSGQARGEFWVSKH